MVYTLNLNTIKNRLSVISVIFTGMVFAPSALAGQKHQSIVDIYGTQQLSASDITRHYGKDFDLLTNMFFIKNNTSEPIDSEQGKRISNKIKKGLRQMGQFSYLNITPILYPNTNDIYYTVDAVNKNDEQRLKVFLSKPLASFPDPDKLIATWQEYEKLVFANFMRNKTEEINYVCPVFHCIEGKYLKKYNPRFENLVPKNKDKLVAILQGDKDEDKRAAAAYLLAYISNGTELINILVPAMKDPSPLVRNNTMRVLAYALITKLKDADFPVQEAINALDYPTAYDRNKAEAILLGLGAQPRYAKYIKEHAKKQLMTQLHMLQPNVHDMSYNILQEISGLKLGDRDYQAWENWLNSTKANTPSTYSYS